MVISTQFMNKNNNSSIYIYIYMYMHSSHVTFFPRASKSGPSSSSTKETQSIEGVHIKEMVLVNLPNYTQSRWTAHLSHDKVPPLCDWHVASNMCNYFGGWKMKLHQFEFERMKNNSQTKMTVTDLKVDWHNHINNVIFYHYSWV